MKRLPLYLFLILFTLQTPSLADDIRDFQIEGMSIGDSLLDYFSEEEIKKMSKVIYPKSTKYIKLEYGNSTKFDTYESVTFHVKENDKRFIIHTINGVIFFENELTKCLNKKKEVVKNLTSIFENIEPRDYDYKYEIDDGKSIAYISDFDFKDDSSIRVFCINWSEITEKKRNFGDTLSISISTNYLLEWLDTAQ